MLIISTIRILHVYHYARALANLAEIMGRIGLHDDAFRYFNIMKSVYMKQEHPELLLGKYGKCFSLKYVNIALYQCPESHSNENTPIHSC